MASSKLEQYKKSFDAELDALVYLRTYYDPKDNSTYDINTQHITDAIEVLKARSVSGGKVLEVGCGPYIANSLIASHFFDEIYPSDYSLAMLQPLKKWITGEAVGFDNQYMINFVANQLYTPGEELVNETKSKVKELLLSDVHNINPLGERKMTFDAIITRFCIDSCSPDIDSYKQAVKNVTICLKQGGYFLQMGFFNHGIADITKGYWDLGDMRFQDVRLPKQDVLNSVKEAGMTIVEWRERIHQSNVEEAFLNTSSYTLLAVKK